MLWAHDALAEDLAQHLRCDQRMVWADMQLGPSGSPRPDVYTLDRSYSRPQATAYECKISRSDLRSDTTSGKWQKYLAFAGAVIFAVPDGLCTAAEIPPSCGLMVRKAAMWRHVRKPTRSPCALPMDACMKLLIDGVARTVSTREPRPRSVGLWKEHNAVRQKFGEAVAKAARDLAGAQTDVASFTEMKRAGYARVDREVAAHREYLMGQVKTDMAAFEQAKADLIEWLELPDNSHTHAIRRRIAELKQACAADDRVHTVEAAMERARQAVEGALHYLRPPK